MKTRQPINPPAWSRNEEIAQIEGLIADLRIRAPGENLAFNPSAVDD
jgi:hypothetical protein